MFTPDELQRLIFVWDNAVHAGLAKSEDIVKMIQEGDQSQLDHYLETLDLLYWHSDK